MREIKFRAWYGENIGMLTPQFNGDINEIFVQKNGIYMQFTGLKDKNYRDIYEGDIVRNHRRYSNELLEVFWQEEVADYSSDGVYWTKEVPGFRFKRINKGMMTVFVANVDLEVIGNIYENSELLEASHASK